MGAVLARLLGVLTLGYGAAGSFTYSHSRLAGQSCVTHSNCAGHPSSFTYCKYYAIEDDSGICTITCLGALILLVAAVAVFIIAARCMGKRWYEKKKAGESRAPDAENQRN